MRKVSTLMDAVKFVRNLFIESSELISALDYEFAKYDFEGERKGVAITEGSNSLMKPMKWIPYEVFRFYKSKKQPNICAFSCVIFDDNPKYDETEFSDCTATVGAFVFPAKYKWIQDKEYWWARHQRYIKNRVDDGRIYDVDPKKLWPDEEYSATRIITLGVPLIDIIDSKVAHQLLIEPLMNKLNA